MSTKTKIQWCDSTVNPVMGCDGCQLLPSTSQLRKSLETALISQGIERSDAAAFVTPVLKNYGPSELYQRRQQIAIELAEIFELSADSRPGLAKAIGEHFRCYASQLHLRYSFDPLKPDKGVNPGMAPVFERPQIFPGRTKEAAAWKDLKGTNRPEKPWLADLPRLIFVSDMGDALSTDVAFDYLKQEIIDPVTSSKGQRHLWLWLTKRPARMAMFSKYLRAEFGLAWPDNLVAMTSIMEPKSAAKAVESLCQVPAKVRALSVEPLWGNADIDLDGIDWVIVGGESGHYAKPFDLSWAHSLRQQCIRKKVAFFVKQLGARPVLDGTPLHLKDGHGGDWSEWPSDLCFRQMPEAFWSYATSLV